MSSAFGNVESVLVIGIIACLVYFIVRRMFYRIKYILIVLLLMELLYVFGQTGINNYIPIARYIPNDVFMSIGRLFGNTFIATWLNSVGSFISGLMIQLFNTVFDFATGLFKK